MTNTYITRDGQDIFDISILLYGSYDAYERILADNPDLQFDNSELLGQPDMGSVDISLPLVAGQAILYDDATTTSPTNLTKEVAATPQPVVIVNGISQEAKDDYFIAQLKAESDGGVIPDAEDTYIGATPRSIKSWIKQIVTRLYALVGVVANKIESVDTDGTTIQGDGVNSDIAIVNKNDTKLYANKDGVWTEIPDVDLSELVKLDQTTKQTMTRSPIIDNLKPGSLLMVDSDKSIRDLTGLTWDDVNKRLGVGVTAALDNMVVGDQNPVGTANRIASFVGNSNSVRTLQVENASVGSSSEIRVEIISGTTLFALIVPSPARTGTFLGTNRGANNYLLSALRALTIATSGGHPITFSTNSIARGIVTSAGLFGIGTVAPSKLLHAAGSAGYLSTANMDNTPEAFASKAYVDAIVQAAIKIQADWNANTNTPNISGTTTTGHAWRVTTAGSTNLGGITSWAVGDLAVKIDTGWMKIGNGQITLNWGAILGDITAQTDLTARINALIDAATHTYDWGDIVGDITAQTDLTARIEQLIEDNPPAPAAWGDITGDVTDQSDLMTEMGTIAQAAVDATRIVTNASSSATLTPTGNARENELYVTAQAASATIAAPSGTPVNGNTLLIRIKDNGTARSLTFNAVYSAFAEALPTTTIAGKTMYLGFIYNSQSSKWEFVSMRNEL
jgi:hypothetical protein